MIVDVRMVSYVFCFAYVLWMVVACVYGFVCVGFVWRLASHVCVARVAYEL